MRLDEKTSRLVAELEYYIGSECYNPNSYDGWNNVEGCDFRYPISVPDDTGEFTKIRGRINSSCSWYNIKVTPDTVNYMKYRFGSNELFIGKGIINILQFLEERYGLDFNELENSAPQEFKRNSDITAFY